MLSTYFKKLRRETGRVIAHGILHLCGYKDKTDEEQKTNECKRRFYIYVFLENRIKISEVNSHFTLLTSHL